MRPPVLDGLLTARELEVLALMATGATNDRIAQRLVIATGTVKSHVKQILRKLQVENRAEAISQYLRLTIGAREGGGVVSTFVIPRVPLFSGTRASPPLP